MPVSQRVASLGTQFKFFFELIKNFPRKKFFEEFVPTELNHHEGIVQRQNFNQGGVLVKEFKIVGDKFFVE